MYIVIMAGGIGSRFWPRSRKSFPKHLLNIIGNKSMIQLTYDRIKSLTTPDKIIIITNVDQKQIIQKQLTKVPKENIIAEPCGRNTAPCIALAAAIIQSKGAGNEVMVILPADHLIIDVENFKNTILTGVEYAHGNDSMITIGIKPTFPETGYGYIQLDSIQYDKNNIKIFKVKTFAEKPNIETARRFLKSGDFLWNSGMFIWSADVIMNEIDENLPELFEGLKKIIKLYGTPIFFDNLKDLYSRTKSISIDYAILEVAKNVVTIQSDLKWSDLGSWESVYNILPKDEFGNVVSSKASALINAKNNYFYSKNKLIAAVDIEDLIVVEMGDAILICKKDKSQNVRSIVDYLKRNNMGEYI
jgi:mannose-1-phosphate guanylyltransferase